jgi:hypothetical protein
VGIAEHDHLCSLAKSKQGATPRGDDVTADDSNKRFVGHDRYVGAETLPGRSDFGDGRGEVGRESDCAWPVPIPPGRRDRFRPVAGFRGEIVSRRRRRLQVTEEDEAAIGKAIGHECRTARDLNPVSVDDHRQSRRQLVSATGAANRSRGRLDA